MTPTSDSIRDLVTEILAFRDARDWKQFHTPKNLAAALAIEASELQEALLWKTDAEVDAALKQPEFRARVSQEIADVLIYALLAAHEAGIQPEDAIRSKLALNSAKYPVDKAKGSAAKYTELGTE